MYLIVIVLDKIRTDLAGNQDGNECDMLFTKAREAFMAASSLVPCDLLEEMMHGIVVLHHEAAKVFGTTRIPVDTFFPILSFVLLFCDLPHIHSQLYLLENFAITSSNLNGEESYYVYCIHAAVEYICNFSSKVQE